MEEETKIEENLNNSLTKRNYKKRKNQSGNNSQTKSLNSKGKKA